MKSNITTFKSGLKLEMDSKDHHRLRTSRCLPRWFTYYWECRICGRIFPEGTFNIETKCCNQRRFKKYTKPLWTSKEYNGFLKKCQK